MSLLFVTGLSGSGKSYVSERLMGQGLLEEMISLDQFTKYLLSPSEFRKEVTSDTMLYYIDNILEKKKEYEVTWDDDVNRYHDQFVDWLINQGKDFIVEGIQVYNGMISDRILANNEIVFVNTNFLLCSIYRIKRGFIEGKTFKEKLSLIRHNGLIKKFHIENYKLLQKFIQQHNDNIILLKEYELRGKRSEESSINYDSCI